MDNYKLNTYSLQMINDLNINPNISQKNLKPSFTYQPSYQMRSFDNNALRTTYSTNSSKKIPSASFTNIGNQINQKTNWNQILNIDPTNQNEIMDNIDYLLNLQISSNDVITLPENFFMHIFQLYKSLARNLIAENQMVYNENQQLQEKAKDVEKLNKKLLEKRSIIQKLKSENEELKRINAIYKTTKINKDYNSDKDSSSPNPKKSYFCKYCCKKRFKNEYYLQEHYKRRHLINYNIEDKKEDIEQNEQVDKKLDELRKYFDGKFINYHYLNGMNMLSNELTNLKHFSEYDHQYMKTQPLQPIFQNLDKNRNLNNSNNKTDIYRNRHNKKEYMENTNYFKTFNKTQLNKYIDYSDEEQRSASKNHESHVKNEGSYINNPKVISQIEKKLSQTYQKNYYNLRNQQNGNNISKNYQLDIIPNNNNDNYGNTSFNNYNYNNNVDNRNALIDFYIRYKKREKSPNCYKTYKCLVDPNFNSKINADAEINNMIKGNLTYDDNHNINKIDDLYGLSNKDLILYCNNKYFNFGKEAKQYPVFGFYSNKIGDYLDLKNIIKDENNKINMED